MYQVTKRDGRVVDFTLDRIYNAIQKSFDGIGKLYTKQVLQLLALRTTAAFEPKVKDGKVSVEDIQDAVEQVLSEAGYHDVAKAYILYRKQHEKVRNACGTLLDYKETVDKYLRIKDWRVKENSTVSYSVGGLILSNSGAITANYWLSEVYDEEIANAHRNCDLHLHDLSMLTGYCAGWSLKQLIQEGLGGIPGKITSSPASHLSTLCNQMVNFLGILQNEWAGAQAFSSFDTYLAPFVRVDNLDLKEVKQCIQSFIYGVNTPSRWGTQAPFSNITLDWVCPPDLKELPAIVGGKELGFTYGDCQREMDIVNRAFMELMIEGDANGRGFQYPIPTYSITKDFDWSDTENNRLLFEMAAKYGIPYFSNYVNSDMQPSDVRSMCPLTGDTFVLVKQADRISIRRIDAITDTVSVWNGKTWVSGAPVQTEATDVYDITLSNGLTVSMGENHLQLLATGETVKASELKVGQWLPFNKQPVTTVSSSDDDYLLGLAVGAFCGDGNWAGSNRRDINYSLNDNTKSELLKDLQRYWSMSGYHTREYYNGNCLSLYVGAPSGELMQRYITGTTATTKGLSDDVFNASVDFKIGLLDGYWLTDGTRARKRIATSSDKMRHDLQMLLSMIGRKALITYSDARAGRLGTKPNYRVDMPERTCYGNYYREYRDYNAYSIVSITRRANTEKLYCFEVADDSHLFMLANGLITHNCRLRMDLRELRKKSGGFFGSGESTGSIGVVTLNMPRLAYQSTDEADFFQRLDSLMDLAARSLKTKRKVITQLLDAGLYPYTKRYLGTFSNHFSTIGLVGMNEACMNAPWLHMDLSCKPAQEFTAKVLKHMRDRLVVYQERDGDLYNLEATPAESTCYRFALHDKERFPDIITANDGGTPYYTNSSHLPVHYTDDVYQALDVQDSLQTLYTGGTVFHAFLGKRMDSWVDAMNLVRSIAENYKLPYYTLSPTYSVCREHGYLVGTQCVCPHCGAATELYSRITGYYRPVQNWNDGKVQEFADRLTYNVSKQQEPCAAATPQASYILFTTKTCPNCPVAKRMLDEAKIDYRAVYAEDEPKLAERYNIFSVPALVAVDGSETYVGIGTIKGFCSR